LKLPDSKELKELATNIRNIARIFPRPQSAVYLEKAAQLARQNASAEEHFRQEIRDHIEDMRDFIVSFTVRRGMLPEPPAANPRGRPGMTSLPASDSYDDFKAWLKHELKHYVRNHPSNIAMDHPSATGLWIPEQLSRKLEGMMWPIRDALYKREGATSDEDKERLRPERYKQYLAFAIEQLYFFDQLYKAVDYRENDGKKRMHARMSFGQRIKGAVKTFADNLEKKKE
jgi:hypothetical protein